MAKFRTGSSNAAKPTSPVLLFRELKRHPTIKFLGSHQEKLLELYEEQHWSAKDVAIELPTGAGKTLVGMLIAEYRRRLNGECIVFCCPTKQLAAQVTAQCAKYGIPTSLLIGEQKKYDQASFLRYQQAKSIAVTTYSGIFNSNPRIDDPDIVICDDAHAAEGYVASMWTVFHA